MNNTGSGKRLRIPLALSAMLMAATATYSLASSLDAMTVAIPQNERTVGDNIEVEVFFWYGCTYCNAVERPIAQWKANQPDVDVHHVPAVLADEWEPHARLYYLSKASNSLHRTHFESYRQVRAAPTEALDTKVDIMTYLGDRGHDTKRMAALYASPGLNQQLAFDQQRMNHYGLIGTPAAVIDGTYLIYPSTSDPDEFVNQIETVVDTVRQLHGENKE